MTLREFYNSIGVDPSEVIQRFGGSEAMLEKFLKKFLADTTYSQLGEAMAAKDWELVFRAAHTMKGLAGNFDFIKLRDSAAKMVERYRANDFEPIPALYEELKDCYDTIVEKLNLFLA